MTRATDLLALLSLALEDENHSHLKGSFFHLNKGNYMLSGMNPKIQNRNQKAIDKWLADGNEITVIPSKFPKSHTTRTKSHMVGGMGSRYLSGGTRNTSGRSRQVA